MLFEIALLGLAYAGSKIIREDGILVREARRLDEKILRFLGAEPGSAPSGEAALAIRGEDSAQALQTHYRRVGVLATGAMALRNFVPFAGALGFASYVYGLAPHLRNTEEDLKRTRRINVDALFLLADALALVTGSYTAAAFSLYLIQAGKLAVLRAKDNNRKQIQNLFRGLPSSVWVVRDGAEVEVPIAAVRKDDVVALNGGNVVPVDGVIVEGFAGVDQQALTGEAQLAEKGPGDRVFANTVLHNGRIRVRVERSGEETTANQITKILYGSIAHKSKHQLKGEQWADQLTHPMFFSSLALLPLVGPVSTSVFINAHMGMRIRMLAPMVTLKHITLASREGLLVKDGRALEKFLEVDAILFDKTGTLTHEDPEVGEVFAFGAHPVEEIVRYAAIAEHKLTHPIAKAIVDKANRLGVSVPSVEDASYSIGYGTKVLCRGEVIQAGSLRYLEGDGIPVPKACRQLEKAQDASGHSHVFLAVDRKIIGALQLQPRVRSQIAEVVAQLREQGIAYLAIVSGDRDAPTRALAEQLGMDGYFSSTLPEQKAEIVSALQKNGRKVCFVGDGINDSIALKQADVSISLAGANTIAKDMADIVIMHGRLDSIVSLRQIARDLDKNLRGSLALSVAPGAINFLGAFVFDFNTLASLMVSGAFGAYGALSALPPKSESAPGLLPSHDEARASGDVVAQTSAA